MNSETLKTTTTSVSNTAEARLQRTLAFEIETGGHHASYIRNFAQQWSENLAPHQIHFVVTPDFFQKHADVVELIESFETDAVQIHSITPTENNLIQGRVNRMFKGWKLFCKYATQLGVDRGLLMYSDRFQIPMLVGQASPCPVSCIYFRPTFHYGTLDNYRPNWKQRLAAWRKRYLVKRLLKLKQMDVLFSLDSLAVGFIKNNFPTKATVCQLPDSFVRSEPTAAQIANLHSDLKIEQGRKVCLLLGSLDSRKGPLQLLDAAQRLPESRQKKLCLLLVGSLHGDIHDSVIDRIDRLRKETLVQVVLKNEYVPDTTVQRYYELADVALTTYQKHMGMSSAIIRAALAKTPVLSSDYGLMGALVKRQKLGITVDTTNPIGFTEGLAAVIDQPGQQLFDVLNASAFASSHSPAALAEALKAWAIR